MSDELHDSIDSGLNVMTGRRNVLKGASGLALGSLGLSGLPAANSAAPRRLWPRTPPRLPHRERPATSRTSSSSWATTSAG